MSQISLSSISTACATVVGPVYRHSWITYLALKYLNNESALQESQSTKIRLLKCMAPVVAPHLYDLFFRKVIPQSIVDVTLTKTFVGTVACFVVPRCIPIVYQRIHGISENAMAFLETLFSNAPVKIKQAISVQTDNTWLSFLFFACLSGHQLDFSWEDLNIKSSILLGIITTNSLLHFARLGISKKIPANWGELVAPSSNTSA